MVAFNLVVNIIVLHRPTAIIAGLDLTVHIIALCQEIATVVLGLLHNTISIYLVTVMSVLALMIVIHNLRLEYPLSSKVEHNV